MTLTDYVVLYARDENLPENYLEICTVAFQKRVMKVLGTKTECMCSDRKLAGFVNTQTALSRK